VAAGNPVDVIDFIGYIQRPASDPVFTVEQRALINTDLQTLRLSGYRMTRAMFQTSPNLAVLAADANKAPAQPGRFTTPLTFVTAPIWALEVPDHFIDAASMLHGGSSILRQMVGAAETTIATNQVSRGIDGTVRDRMVLFCFNVAVNTSRNQLHNRYRTIDQACESVNFNFARATGRSGQYASCGPTPVAFETRPTTNGGSNSNNNDDVFVLNTDGQAQTPHTLVRVCGAINTLRDIQRAFGSGMLLELGSDANAQERIQALQIGVTDAQLQQLENANEVTVCRVQHLASTSDVTGRSLVKRRGTVKFRARTSIADILATSARLKHGGCETYFRYGVLRFVAKFDLTSRFVDEQMRGYPQIEKILGDARIRQIAPSFHEDVDRLRRLYARRSGDGNGDNNNDNTNDDDNDNDNAQQQQQQQRPQPVDETAIVVSASQATAAATLDILASAAFGGRIEEMSPTGIAAVVRLQRPFSECTLNGRPLSIGAKIRMGATTFEVVCLNPVMARPKQPPPRPAATRNTAGGGAAANNNTTARAGSADLAQQQQQH
jgi:hypothetical protein